MSLNTENSDYEKPVLEKIEIDQNISLIMTTSGDGDTPPDHGGDPGGGGIWG